MSARVVIVGRPNVGKSTLFNRLAGRRLAIVDDRPGVTRDWREADVRFGGLAFTLVDTAGLEEVEEPDSLAGRTHAGTDAAVHGAAVILFVFDARSGLLPQDRHFAQWLRCRHIPVRLVANKAEGRVGAAGALEGFGLGLGTPIPISAEHGEGLADLVEALLPYVEPPIGQVHSASPSDDGAMPDEVQIAQSEVIAAADADVLDTADLAWNQRPLNLVIVGRPNVGKSTLLNALAGTQRALTDPQAGTTRDAVTIAYSYGGRALNLIDTAGMRRRSRVDDRLERMAVADALYQARMSHVVVLVLDPGAILDRQDLAIGRLVLEEGRGLVVAINKWDAVADRAQAIRKLKDGLEARLPQAKGVPWVTISALRRQGLDGLMESVFRIYDLWNQRIQTAQLNRWLAQAISRHPPPVIDGRRLRIRYMTQVKARPPTFVAWSARPAELPETYSRYLVNDLREYFSLPGIPLRFLLRRSRNPFSKSQ